jgi:hypothetical protein
MVIHGAARNLTHNGEKEKNIRKAAGRSRQRVHSGTLRIMVRFSIVFLIFGLCSPVSLPSLPFLSLVNTLTNLHYNGLVKSF